MIINPAQQVHGEEEINAAIEVIKSGRWAEGIEAMKFRNELARFLDVKHLELTNSGSSANLAAIMSLTTSLIPDDRRLKKGDEVITPALCFPTTVSPIIYAGAVPVFVDVDEAWGIDAEEIKKAITPKTRAIVAAHNLGNPFNLDEIQRICRDNNLWLIEDNCDALGSEWSHKKTGTFGDIGTSSFYPAHHISCGEGGAVYTNDPILAKSIFSLINWGRDCTCRPGCDNTCGKRYKQQHGGLPMGYDHKNTYSTLGFNLKMTDIQAALGLQQMKRLPAFREARRKNFKMLKDLFMKYVDWFEIPKHYHLAYPNWFGYVVKLKENTPFTKQEMVDYLQENGIGSRAFFCGNITKQPCLWEKDGYRIQGNLTRTDDLMNNSFWIGVHPAIGSKERKYMKETIIKFLQNYV